MWLLPRQLFCISALTSSSPEHVLPLTISPGPRPVHQSSGKESTSSAVLGKRLKKVVKLLLQSQKSGAGGTRSRIIAGDFLHYIQLLQKTWATSHKRTSQPVGTNYSRNVRFLPPLPSGNDLVWWNGSSLPRYCQQLITEGESMTQTRVSFF